MSAIATCAFCNCEAPANEMDITGHGMRCRQCLIKSHYEVFQGKARHDMTNHLTWSEIERVVVDAGREALAGAVIAILSVVMTVLIMESGSTIKIIFTGLFATGFGMIVHGLHRRKQAKLALAQTPAARIVG